MDGLSTSILIKKGAEANLYLSDWHGRKAILKRRLPKKYRPTLLDHRIRFFRTAHEPQLLSEARKAGVLTPLIYSVNVRQGLIVMQFVEGRQVKVLLNECASPERKSICRIIGRSVGKLHRRGIIHGDLTTSNMIMSNDGKIFFLDFGLGERNSEVEAMGVDLHLMKRALESTHFQFADECFRYILRGYSDVVGSTLAQEVREKMMEIRRRGRYVSERKREP